MRKTHDILLETRAALPTLTASSERKNAALLAIAERLLSEQEEILAANREDIEASRDRYGEVMLDRLTLTPERIAGMAQGVREVAALPDPEGKVLRRVERPNGLVIEKTSVPLGVIAIIYESRPNVTSDAAVLALKSGNAVILRGGREAFRSNAAIVRAIHHGLEDAGLPAALVGFVEDTDHASAEELMTAVGLIDLLIPRGGAGLIRRCTEQAKVPCIQTGTGICHIFVDASADQDKALNIIENAKTSRPSVCNAEEVLLVHRDIAPVFLPKLQARLVGDREARGLVPVELRLDPRAAAIIPGTPAGETDFDREFLDYILAVAVVDSTDDRRRHRPHRPSLHRPQRRHPHTGRRERGEVHGSGRLCRGLCKCLYPLHRRRRVRSRLRNGHFHAEAPCPRTDGSGGTEHLQVRHPRKRPDPLILSFFCIPSRRFGQNRCGGIKIVTNIIGKFPLCMCKNTKIQQTIPLQLAFFLFACYSTFTIQYRRCFRDPIGDRKRRNSGDLVESGAEGARRKPNLSGKRTDGFRHSSMFDLL